MSGLNKVQIIGYLGRDPEIRYTASGMAVANFSVAVTERRKKGETWEDQTEWFRVKTFGKTAENAAQYLQKGKQVYVEGRQQTSEYTDKEGVKKVSVELVADTVTFLGSAVAAGGNARKYEQAKPSSRAARVGASRSPVTTQPTSDGFDDDDLPF